MTADASWDNPESDIVGNLKELRDKMIADCGMRPITPLSPVVSAARMKWLASLGYANADGTPTEKFIRDYGDHISGFVTLETA